MNRGATPMPLPWPINPLVTGIRTWGMDSITAVFDRYEVRRAAPVSLLDLTLQVMLVSCSYSPDEVWLGDKTELAIICELLCKNDAPEAANVLRHNLKLGRIRLNQALISALAVQQLSILQNSVRAVVRQHPLVPVSHGFGALSRLKVAPSGHVTDIASGDSIEFRRVSPRLSRACALQHHYLHAWRADETLAVGAFRRNADTPFAWASYSPVTRAYKQAALSRLGLDPAGAAELTRAWNSQDAPRNSLSLLFAYGSRVLRTLSPAPTTLISDINPNLGFIGSAFRAVGFRLIPEKPTQFHYVGSTPNERWFVSRRQIEPGQNISRNQFPLLPTKILALPLDTRPLQPEAPIMISMAEFQAA